MLHSAPQNNIEVETALEPATFTLTQADLYQVRVVKQVAFYRYGDEIGSKAACHISVLLERKYWICSKIAPELMQRNSLE